MLRQAGPAGFLEQKIAGYAANLELETRGWLDHYLYALALTFAGADSLVDAERELRKARELQPQSVDVARTLSWVLLNREPQAMDALPRAEEVVELIERQLSRMSEDTVGYRELEYSLSLALFRLRKFDRAESILKRFDSDFDEVSSGRSAYLSLRADLAYRNGDNESAIVWLEQLLAAEETTGREDRLGELYARLGVVLYAAGKVDRALKVLSDSALRYAQSGGTQKANHLKRTVALLRNQPVWDKTQTGRQLEAWKWGLSGVERILFIASSRAAEAQALAVEPTTAGDEDEDEDATTAADLETTSPKGATISPYGDEEHWHKWSYATVSYNRGEQTFDLVEMSASIIDRVGVLESIWNQGVLEFGYVREVRDVLFDSLARLNIQSDPKVVSALERLMKQVPQEVRLTRAWKNLSEEFEAFILRDLTGALELCGLIPYLTLSETTTLAHACDFKAMAQRDVASLDDELKRIDQFLERAPRAPAEQSCSSDVFYQNWRARGALPSDAAALRRFLDDCPSIDAWQRTSLLIAFESVALGGAARGQAISISPQEPSEALIWALDEELIYLGGIETEEGWWFLEIGDGQTKIRRITSEKLLERLKYWRPRNPVLSSSLARLTNRLEPTSWSFVQSFLSFWEKETWEGPKFIAVPESLISLDKCNEVRAKPLRYETLRVNILKGDSLSEKLLDVERCARGAVKFHRLSVNYSSPGTIKDSDFDRIVYLLHQRHRFPFESAQLVAGDYVLNLGPKPTRGIAWIAVWNEYFQPLFANALSARRVQQSKGDQDSHRALVEEIEKLLNVFQGLRLTQPELLDGYIKNADGRAGMLGQVYPKLELFRSQFLTWAIASYEALGDISAASDILRTLLAERAWQGDLDKFRLWSRKQASFFIALEDTEQALNVLENCWAAEVADCGVQLGQVYLSEARYRDAERIADGLVGIADNARANVEGTNMLARIAEQERYDFDAAVELLLRAYAMANNVDLDLRVSLSINLMRVARLAGDYQAAETLGDSVAKWELTPSQRLRIELTRAQTWYVSGQARKVVRAMAKLTNLADDMDDTFGKMLCTSLWALSSLEVGRYDDARRLAESALSQAESLGNRREIANQLNNLGLVYARLGLHEKASQALNAAMTSDFTGRDSMSLAYSMRNLGQQKFLAGLHTQASGLLEESAYLSRKAGDRINEVRARFSFLLNQERLGVEELGERFWRLSEEAGSLRLVEIQWRALFGAYRSLEPSLNPEQALRILEEAFSISMSHIGLASERLGPGREALRNEYHFRLIKADKHLDAIKVALRFAQPASLRKGGKPLSLEGVQERLAESEALWYGWFDERGWQGWLIERDSQVFLGTEWDGDETLKIFADLEKRFKEYTPLGRSLEQLSKAFSYLLKDHLGEITTLKILDLETDLWIPYRALTVNGMLLDEQVRLEWVLPVLSSRAESPEALTYVVSEEESPHDLAFAMLEKSWLGRRLAATEIKQRDIFAPTLTQSHFHLTGHYNGLGKLEDLWFRQEGDGQTNYWPRRIFINTCGPAGESTRVAERYGALLTALSNGTDLALTHRLRISDWAASIISKRYYQTDTSEPVSERAREATRYVRRMFEHPAHWAGFEVITGL
ncbi:MAG: tetratricopeptide repeat protein [Myxococcota bacterium]|nr:tetratricopeptide repeat protein [Myxococcota bacterium]